MKKTMTILAGALLVTTFAYAQPVPAAEASAQILLPDNGTITGSVKENIRKKGEVQFTTDGKRTRQRR